MTKMWLERETSEVSTEFVFRNVVELLCLRGQTLESRDHPAFSFMSNGESIDASLTFGQLDAHARRIAGHLQAMCRQGDRVLLVLPPGLDYIAAFFGCLYAGVIGVPALPPSSSRTLPRLDAMARDAQPSVVLSSTSVIGATARVIDGSALGQYQWVAVESLTDASAAWREPDADLDRTAFLQYTSGSTSSPKGVMVSHGNILANVALICDTFDIANSDVIVSWLPPHHDLGLIGKILVPVYAGSHCVQFSPAAFLARPLRWLRALSEHKASITSAPNFAYDLCVDRVTDEEKRALDLSALRFALNGAEAIRIETMRRFADAFAVSKLAPGAMTPVYGLAESTLFVTANVCGDRSRLPDSRPLKAQGVSGSAPQYVSVGRNPSPAHDVRIVDPATSLDCCDGEVGEVWVSGPSVAQGYWQRSEETAAVFDVGASGARYLRTGDLGFVSDNALHITGRIKDLLIFGGRNIYPQDIEMTVEALDPAFRVNGCAVFSIDSERGTKLVVVQEIERRKTVETSHIADLVCGELAEVHEMFDVADIVLVRTGVVPRTSSGKIQRYRCREMFLAGELDPVWAWRRQHDVDYRDANRGHAQLTPTERPVAAVWQEVLARPDISASQSFLELGGQSILAAQIIARLNDEFNLAIPLRALFGAPTVSRLATYIDRMLAQGVREEDSPRIVPVSGDARSPLSFAQQRLWFLDQFEPNSAIHNIPAAMRLKGVLDVTALERTLNELVSRHEALRTRFVMEGGVPHQVLVPALRIDLPMDDLTALPETERERAVAARLESEATQGFDLSAGPLIRAGLIRLGEQEHVMMLTLHHIVSDGWSMGVLVREIAVLYRAFLRGEASPLAPLPVQYADYAHWQRQWLSADVLARQSEYWKNQLTGAPALLTLPTDRPRPSVQRHRGATYHFTVPASISAGLGALSQRVQGTLFMTLAAALNVLLPRYAGQDDISIGTFVANRSRAETYPLVGFFVNTVVLRSHVDPALSFEAFLATVRDGALDAIAHQDLPFQQVLQGVKPERQLSHSPLFQVSLVVQNAPMDTFSLPGLQLERLPMSNAVAQFDLALTVEEVAGVLECGLDYDTDLFDGVSIERMSGHFVRLLEGIVAEPTSRIGDLPMMTAHEQKQLVVHWNDTAVPYPREQTLQGLFEAQVARTPDAVAVVYEEQQLSYGELNARANQLAHHLIGLGVGPDVRVALCLERSAEMVVALLAVLKAGGAYVPLDPTYPAERLAYMLKDSQPRVLITQAHLKEMMSRHGDGLPVIAVDSEATSWANQTGTNLACGRVGVTSRHLAYVTYTSGSTGKPKGVMVEHRGVINMVGAQIDAFGVVPESRILQFASISFDACVFEVVMALCRGASLHLARPRVVLAGEELIRIVAERRITHVTLPPAVLTALPEEAELAGVQTLVVAGEAPSAALVRRWGRERQFVNAHGPTEATVWATQHVCNPDEESAPPIGRPISNATIYILDDSGSPAPIGVAGEIHIGGAGVARGYLNRADLTAERFVADPFARRAGRGCTRPGTWDGGGRKARSNSSGAMISK
jgi:amino acid adenylation domain-containing protein